MDSEALSSNAQRRNQLGGHNPVQDRIRREDERAARLGAQQAAHQTFLDYPTTSIEAGSGHKNRQRSLFGASFA